MLRSFNKQALCEQQPVDHRTFSGCNDAVFPDRGDRTSRTPDRKTSRSSLWKSQRRYSGLRVDGWRKLPQVWWLSVDPHLLDRHLGVPVPSDLRNHDIWHHQTLWIHCHRPGSVRLDPTGWRVYINRLPAQLLRFGLWIHRERKGHVFFGSSQSDVWDAWDIGLNAKSGITFLTGEPRLQRIKGFR